MTRQKQLRGKLLIRFVIILGRQYLFDRKMRFCQSQVVSPKFHSEQERLVGIIKKINWSTSQPLNQEVTFVISRP